MTQGIWEQWKARTSNAGSDRPVVLPPLDIGIGTSTDSGSKHIVPDLPSWDK